MNQESILHYELHLNPYKIQLQQSLKESDTVRHYEFSTNRIGLCKDNVYVIRPKTIDELKIVI